MSVLILLYHFMNKLYGVAAAVAISLGCEGLSAQNPTIININTDNTQLSLRVGDNGRLYQTYLGPKLLNQEDAALLPTARKGGTDGASRMVTWEAYPAAGSETFFEPAIGVIHPDGNRSTYLYYRSHESMPVDGGIQTKVYLSDDKYPVDVTLNYVAYPEENVIKTWSEITNKDKKPVELTQYASGMIYQDANEYYLTEFTGDWGKEAGMTTTPLTFGKKIIDTKLGSRAAMHASPFFVIGLDRPAEENTGSVLMGGIGWTGNFRFTFEIDNDGSLRIIPGINPYASTYELGSNESLTTPEFVFTLSDRGTGQGSRNLHDWSRKYSLKNGVGKRMTLLNNWENTYFKFDQDKLGKLMHEAKELGVDMFLLDDGWFGNKNPRNNATAGLGDWEANKAKLPGGVPALVDSAKAAGVRFGIWIEPEMVNPKSDLYEKHPDWVIEQPNRESYYYRNQLVLDMSNPKVQDYVFGVVDRILTENPEVAYFKWDCNSPITNIYSPYLGKKQGNLYVDHVLGIYNVLDRIKAKYPDVPMMLCSGGGARCDYKALEYFTEFWPSDDTDPAERIFIQWGFSHFLPAKSISAHVTSWNRDASVKFRGDVASMGRLGFDIGLQDLTHDDLKYCREAVANWKRLYPTTMDGDLYRLVSPYSGNHAASSYVSKDRRQAVVYTFDLHPRLGEKLSNVRLQGLDPDRRYTVSEINLMPGKKSTLPENGKTFSGDYLMKIGLKALTGSDYNSRVIELNAN